MEGTTTVTGLRRTIYIATEELWNEIQDAADRKDWSVSRYLMNCHRSYLKKGAKVVKEPRVSPMVEEPVVDETPPTSGSDILRNRTETPVKKKAVVRSDPSDQSWRTAKRGTPKQKDKK